MKTKKRASELETYCRTLIPGYDPWRDAEKLKATWHEDIAQFAIDFFHEVLTHVKGEKARTPFYLEPWQQAVLGNLWGWRRPDGTRRYRECLFYVPRKNGKTAFLGGLQHLVMHTDGEPGAECYSSGSDREQASLIFAQAAGMVYNSDELEERCKVLTTTKTIQSRVDPLSFYRAISADSATKHGYNSHLILNDELHTHKNRDLIDVLHTSTGARRQPLEIHATTSDFDRPSICNEKLKYAKDVMAGTICDPKFFPVIFEATLEDDWKDPDVWEKANPNLGVSVSREYIEAECLTAQSIPSYENTFKRLHLNIRTQQDVRWLKLDDWDKCAHPIWDLDGRKCWAGLDLSSRVDLTALTLLFPSEDDETADVWQEFWVPAENARERTKRDRVPYDEWVSEGLIHETPGNVVDYNAIHARLEELRERFQIECIGADPWNCQATANYLQGEGFKIEFFSQGYKHMNYPTKELEKLVLQGALRHGGNKVLRWMAGNVSVVEDAAGNLKPAKDKSTERIDGIVSLILAIGLWRGQEKQKPSKYLKQGLDFV